MYMYHFQTHNCKRFHVINSLTLIIGNFRVVCSSAGWKKLVLTKGCLKPLVCQAKVTEDQLAS